MARQWYKVTMNFNYVNGMTGGVLHTKVNSKKAIKVQIEANRNWLAIKGHKELDVTIEPCDNPNK